MPGCTLASRSPIAGRSSSRPRREIISSESANSEFLTCIAPADVFIRAAIVATCNSLSTISTRPCAVEGVEPAASRGHAQSELICQPRFSHLRGGDYIGSLARAQHAVDYHGRQVRIVGSELRVRH